MDIIGFPYLLKFQKKRPPTLFSKGKFQKTVFKIRLHKNGFFQGGQKKNLKGGLFKKKKLFKTPGILKKGKIFRRI